jgi:hypothetical protein
MADKDPGFGLLILDIYKITFVVFCILLAWSLLRSKKQQDVAVIT